MKCTHILLADDHLSVLERLRVLRPELVQESRSRTHLVRGTDASPIYEPTRLGSDWRLATQWGRFSVEGPVVCGHHFTGIDSGACARDTSKRVADRDMRTVVGSAYGRWESLSRMFSDFLVSWSRSRKGFVPDEANVPEVGKWFPERPHHVLGRHHCYGKGGRSCRTRIGFWQYSSIRSRSSWPELSCFWSQPK